MKELSTNAKALLAAFAHAHQGPPELGRTEFEPRRGARLIAITRRRRVVAAAVAVTGAAAAAATMWLGLRPTPLDRDAASARIHQAQYQNEGEEPASARSVKRGRAAPARDPLRPVPAVLPAKPASEPVIDQGLVQPTRRVARRERSRSSSSARAATLAKEILLLDAAWAAIERGDFEAASQQLDRHRERFPTGELRPERDELRHRLARTVASGAVPNFVSLEEKDR